MDELKVNDISIEAFHDGHENGWHAALFLYGLRDCTVRNNSDEIMRVPLKGQVCYIELDPGQEASLRTIE
jgi:hypothetical protein